MAIFRKQQRKQATQKVKNLLTEPASKSYSCEHIFCEEKRKLGPLRNHVEGLRVPQFGNHWFSIITPLLWKYSPNAIV